MDTAMIITVGAAAGVVLLALALTGVVLRRQRRQHEREMLVLQQSSAAELAEMRQRLDDLCASQERLRERASSAGLLITDVGEDPPEMVPDRAVVSATLGAPLIKAAATAYGVRRALSAENRNRIRFEMRREVRRARKQRKREMRAAWRDARTGQGQVA
ncbi:MAG: hypothetical protein EOO74_05595 [Myxococcales bacterium]|nr:MAG: hypothetical protein EOO74_05595 [Myxococcales bacterium]